jgi:archaeal flagellar protein FlaJ
MILIPFSFLPKGLLRKLSGIFFWLGGPLSRRIKSLDLHLKQSKIRLRPNEYLSMCITSTFFFFVIFSILVSLLLVKLGFGYGVGIFSVLFVSLFIFAQQIMYPKLRANKKIRSIEKNLLPALQNMLVQLGSGVPLFNVMATISDSDYGGVSEQFRIAIRKINAGEPQIRVLEELARDNPSLYFRRTMWQIISGMETGTDMTDVIKLSIDNLSEEQIIQIQKYGSQLNPLAMFYMIIAVIIPSLGITFIIILASFLNLSPVAVKFVFWGLLALVFFFQLMFIGMLKTRKPNLI